MGAVSRLTRRLIPLLVATGLILSLAPVAVAAAPVTFGTPTADSTFGTGIVFSQPVTVSAPIGRVELLLTVADAIGPNITVVPNAPAAGSATLTYTLDLSGNAHLIPNTGIVARWRLFPADGGAAALGPELHVVYADDRFDWKVATGDLVRVHWYEGDAAFGAKALKLGEDEVAATSKLLGVTETEPVDFFVYADVDKFYDALGPGAHENVAGSAYANIRTLLGLIPPDQIDDPLVAVRIPHEFVHLVFDTASKNPYHSPPRWLNEGLAVYQSEGYGTSDRGQVADAAGSGNLIPLDGLTGEFPNGNDFYLAYAESVAAVDYMIRTYGSDALVSLVKSVRGRPHRQRSVHGRARARHDRVQHRLVQERQRDAQDEVRSAAGAGRSGAVGLVRGGTGWRGRVRCSGGSRRARRDGICGTGRGDTGGQRWDAGLADPRAGGGRRRGRRSRPAGRRRRSPPTTEERRAVTVMRRIRAIPSWQVTLGFALLALGFLIAAQLASEAPAGALYDTGADPAGRDGQRVADPAGRSQGTDPRPARQDPDDRDARRGFGRPRPAAQRAAPGGAHLGWPDRADRDRDRHPARGFGDARPARRERVGLPRRVTGHPARGRAAVGRGRRGDRGQRRTDHADLGDHRCRDLAAGQLGVSRPAVPGHGPRRARPV